MRKDNINTGLAIALAWPQTYCKQPGSWYDPLTLLLGVNRNGFYKVGHAALVLIDNKNYKAHYFDFGRYHAPFKHGRVRSAETDHELEIKTVPQLSEDGKQLVNYVDILYELQTNPACHGEGQLYASYCPVHFEQAYDKARQMQAQGPIAYGPFHYKGSNCSRFVNTAILAGAPGFEYRFRLKYRVPLTPTPMNNVNALDHYRVLPKFLNGKPFKPVRKLEKHLQRSTLPRPEKHPAIPPDVQWLAGEGAGSWFWLEPVGNRLKGIRYSPHGDVECEGIYECPVSGEIPDIDHPLTVTHPSNCKTISIRTGKKVIRFNRAE